jgi:hypothetical protein
MRTPKYDDFAQRFDLGDDVIAAEDVPAAVLPPPFFQLLCHPAHMTVAVETYFGDRVDVLVQSSTRDGDHYARKIRLALAGSGRCVQFGVVRIELADLAPPVREAILAEGTPLGRVLIDHGVFTTVEPVAYLKVSLGPALCTAFDVPYPSTTYGRIGMITADGHPAIEVLEILTPTAKRIDAVPSLA